VIGITLGLGLAVLALMVSLNRPVDLVWHELGRRRGAGVLPNVWMALPLPSRDLVGPGRSAPEAQA